MPFPGDIYLANSFWKPSEAVVEKQTAASKAKVVRKVTSREDRATKENPAFDDITRNLIRLISLE